MKRLLFLTAVAGLGLLLSAAAYQAQTSAVLEQVLAVQPGGEFPLQLRLNGSPVYLGHTRPRADGGTSDSIDAGPGNIAVTQCYAVACVCPGTTCTCGNVAGANVGASTTGRLIAANGVVTMVLPPSNGVVTTAAASGSLLLDAGAGAECDHWVL